jgi:hypothetical protein
MFARLILIGHSPLFPTDKHRLAFARRASQEAAAWDVELLAWRLLSYEALLLLHGQPRALTDYGRMLRTHHGSWSARHGHPVRWAAALSCPLPSELLARECAAELHRDGGDHGDRAALRDAWSSLWDGLGLRQSSWFRPRWLAAEGSGPLLRAAGWRGPPPGVEGPGRSRNISFETILAAAALATGRAADDRDLRQPAAHAAVQLGLPRPLVGAALLVEQRMLGRILETTPGAAVRRIVAITCDRRLRAALEPDLPDDPTTAEMDTAAK